MGTLCRYFRRWAFLFISLLVLLFGLPMNANAYVISGGGLTEGFDGAGLGSANINYFLGWSGEGDGLNGLDANVSVSEMETSLANAMATWSSVADISFNYLGDANTSLAALAADPWGTAADPTLVMYFHDETGNFPFDGEGLDSVFAHAWGPDSAGSGGASYVYWGNIHMDSEENWLTGSYADGELYADLGGVDLETIFLHELGHSLGLSHVGGYADALAGDPVMSTYSDQVYRSLGEDDIAGIRQLYSFNGEDWSDGDPGTGDPGSSVPEPATALLFVTGFTGLGFFRRKKKHSFC